MENKLNKYDNYLFETFLQNLRKSLMKSQYKKTLLEIKLQENNYLYLEEYWKLIEIKIRVYLKLIEKRILKYNNVHPKFLLIEKLLDNTNEELEMFYSIIECYDVESIQMEIYLQLYLNYSFQLAFYYLNAKNLAEALGVLGLSEKLINNSIHFMKIAETYSISQKILLLLSAVLIADHDYEGAKIYQRKCIRLNHLELVIRFNKYEVIDVSKCSVNEAYSCERAFLNMMLIFYHHGVSEENLGNLFSSSISYKSAKWITQKFLKQRIPGLVQFLTDVCLTLSKVSKLFFNLKCLSNRESNPTKSYRNPSKTNEDEIEKSKDRSTRINEMKFQEVEMWDGNNKNDKIKQILYSVRLYNTIMSKEFKDVLNKMNRFDLHNLDKETKEMIQKRCNKIRSEEHYKKINNEVKKKSKFNHHSLSNQYNFTEGNAPINNLFDNQIKKRFQSFRVATAINTSNNSGSSFRDVLKVSYVKKEPSFPLETSINNNNYTIFNQKLSNTKTNRVPSKIRETDTSENVEKYSMEKYFFSTNYQKKRKHLHCVYDKEINFQKKLLKLKKHEIQPIRLDLNRKGISDKIKKNLLEMVSIQNLKIVKDNVKDNGRNEMLDRDKQIAKNELKKSRLEEKVTKSLDMRSYLEYKEHLCKIRNSQVKIRKEYLLENKSNNNDEIERQNNCIARKVEKDLETLTKLEQINLKEIKKRKSLKNINVK